MAKKITDWFKVATAGRAIDGRVIKESWLQDMADTYDAAAQYCAMIWPEHYRFANAGTVAAVKAEKDELGRLSLYCKLEPNQLLMDYNASGQKLFTSIEVLDNFAKTGRAYLGGLGITDQPASLGTDRLAFSQIPAGEHGSLVISEPLEAGNFTLPPEGFGSRFASIFLKPSTTECDDMTKEQFEALQQSIDAQTASNAVLLEKFTAVDEKLRTLEAAATAGGEGSGAGDDDVQKQFTALQSENTALKSAVEDMQAKFTTLETQFNTLREKPVPGTQVSENPGEKKPVY